MNFLTTPVLYGLGALALAGGIAAGVQTVRLSNAKADHATYVAKIANLTRIAAEKARKVEQTWASNLNLIDVRYQQDLNNAKAAYDIIVADLRSGAVQLQDRWTCPAANVSGASTGAGEPDGQADLRRTGAAAIVQIADTCDAHVTGLQAVTQSDRAGPQQ